MPAAFVFILVIAKISGYRSRFLEREASQS